MAVENGLRRALFNTYRNGQARISSGALYEDITQVWPYYEQNYRLFVSGVRYDARILEIGCGPGSLLAWLRSVGFSNLEGVDASPGDVEFANHHLESDIVRCGDGQEHLMRYPNTFQVVIMKAVLDHIPKDKLLSFVGAISRSLTQEGVALIDVPNMDWILGCHERYMDLTHEVGFTRESLASLLGLEFGSVKIVGSVPGALSRSQRLFRKPLIALIRRALYVLGEGASDALFESRSIIAVAINPRHR